MCECLRRVSSLLQLSDAFFLRHHVPDGLPDPLTLCTWFNISFLNQMAIVCFSSSASTVVKVSVISHFSQLDSRDEALCVPKSTFVSNQICFYSIPSVNFVQINCYSQFLIQHIYT